MVKLLKMLRLKEVLMRCMLLLSELLQSESFEQVAQVALLRDLQLVATLLS